MKAGSVARRIQVAGLLSLFITLKEFAKILDEADDHHDSRSRQAQEEGDFEQSDKR